MKNNILAKLPASFPWRGNLHCYHSIDSTNTSAKRLASAGAPHGTMVIADMQTHGRGRMGRSFHSPEGTGIYLSLILRPNLPADQLMHLTCAAAVAVADGIERAAGLRPNIKWTNDLVAGGKKLGGILTELSLRHGSTVEYAVIGIGINCCQKEDAFPPELQDIATSLHMCTDKNIVRSTVISEIIVALEQMSQQLGCSSDILQRYRADCITIGQEISLLLPNEIRHGKALDVDENAALVVKFDDGKIESVHSGEVSIRGMYGYV